MLAALLLPLALPQVQNDKLNPPLVAEVNGDVVDLRVTSDGATVVYVADQDVDGSFELYAVPSDRSTPPQRLSGPMVADGGVELIGGAQFALSPDETRVVYVADQDVDEVFEIYSVLLDGSAPPVKLNAPLSGPLDVYRLYWSISPDSSRVVFVSDASADEQYELFSAPIDGSVPPTKLDGVPAFGYATEVWRAEISSDSSWVVYSSDGVTNNRYEIFSVPIDGSSPPVKLNDTLAVSGAYDARISPDATTVAYVARQGTSPYDEVFSVPIDRNSPPVKVSGTPVGGGGIALVDITPDSSRVVYCGVQNTMGVYDLYSAPLDASAASKQLSQPLSSVLGVLPTNARITADGSTAVYRTQTTSGGPYELYSAPVDGSLAPVRIGANITGSVIEFEVHPDSTRVAIRSREGQHDLFTAFVDGVGFATQLAGFNSESVGAFRIAPADDMVLFTVNFTLMSIVFNGSSSANRIDAPGKGFSITGFWPSPIGGDAFYVKDEDTLDAYELYRTDVDGITTPEKLNDPLALGATVGDVIAMKPTADGARVVYTAKQDTKQTTDLYSVPADGSGTSVELNGPASSIHSRVATNYVFSPDGTKVAFAADHATYRTWQLFVAPVDGSSQPIQLSAASGASGVPETDGAFAFTPDGTRLVYLSAQGGTGDVKLYSVPVDGSAAPTRLVPPMPVGGDVIDFLVTLDGARVVYRAEQESKFFAELFTVPIDASAPSVKLNLDPDVSVQPGYSFDASGQLVVYRNGATKNELLSVPVDASAVATKINQPLATNGHVYAHVVTPDGSTVVYTAAVLSSTQIELFARAIDGSGSPVELSALPGSASAVVGAPRVTADGAHVVYLADQDVDDMSELYVVPTDGGSAPTKLNGPLIAFGDVTDWSLDPTGERVVYRADARVNDRFELFTARVQGAPLPRRLHERLSQGGSATGATAFPSDGTLVLFTLRESATPGDTNLYCARLDVPGDAVRINQALATEGDAVSAFAVSADGARVFHIAAQDEVDVQELYASDTPLGTARPATKPTVPLLPLR